MSKESSKSPTQKDQEEKEMKQKPENHQEQSKEDTKVATSSSSAEKESSPSNATMIKNSLLKEAFLLLGNLGNFLPDSDDEKEDTSPPESNVPSSTPPPNSATPSKQPFNDTDNDEDDSQGKEKKKKKEPHGNDHTKKPKEVERYLMKLSSYVGTEVSLLRHIIEYKKQNKVLPSDDSWSLRDFRKNFLGVGVDVSDLKVEIKMLKKKYHKAADEIQRYLTDLQPVDRQGFLSAHSIWSTTCKTDILLDLEHLKKDENASMKILEAEIARYWVDNGKHPFKNLKDMNGFIKNRVHIDDPADKFMEITKDLRRKYEKKVGKILKNVGIVGPIDRVAFYLGKTIWGKKTFIEEQKESSSYEEQLDRSFVESLSSDVGAEIAFLERMVSYKSRKGIYPFEGYFASEDFIQNWLKINVSVSQLKEKLHILKENYEKRKIGGNLDSNDRMAFVYGNMIWDREDAKEREGGGYGVHDFSRYPFLKVASMCYVEGDGERIEEDFRMISSLDMIELDKKCKELYLKNHDLIVKQKTVLLAATIPAKKIFENKIGN